IDYHDTLESYADRVARTALHLVDGDLLVRRSSWSRLRGRRVLQDIGYRSLLALEWLEEGSAAAREAERSLMPALDAAAIHARELATGDTDVVDIGGLVDQVFEAFDAVRHNFPGKIERAFKALGYTWADAETVTGRPRAMWVMAARDILTSGMQSGCPETWRMLGGMARSTVMAFAESSQFDVPGRLAERFVRWVSLVVD